MSIHSAAGNKVIVKAANAGKYDHRSGGQEVYMNAGASIPDVTLLPAALLTKKNE